MDIFIIFQALLFLRFLHVLTHPVRIGPIVDIPGIFLVFKVRKAFQTAIS